MTPGENPYTCRLLIRIDELIYHLQGEKVQWINGTLCLRRGVSWSEPPSHFPGWMFRCAARIQNRWPTTRALFSW